MSQHAMAAMQLLGTGGGRQVRDACVSAVSNMGGRAPANALLQQRQRTGRVKAGVMT